jgi:predicted ATPase with chaperone activity
MIRLPDRALGESRDGVRVNLALADIRKVRPAFDLESALLAMDEQTDRLALQGFVALGELALGRDASRERTGSCRRRSAPAMRGSIRLPFRVRTRGTMLDPCN